MVVEGHVDMVGAEEERPEPEREKEVHQPFAVEPYSSLEQVAEQCSGRHEVEQEAGAGLGQRHFAAAVDIAAARQARAVANRQVFVLAAVPVPAEQAVKLVAVAAAVGL